MSTERSPSALEGEIERERAALDRTLDQLQSRVSVSGMIDETARQIRMHGGEVGRNLGETVKANPMALALTGIGLAWLIAGGGRSASRSDDARRELGSSRLYGDELSHAGHHDDLMERPDEVSAARGGDLYRRPARPPVASWIVEDDGDDLEDGDDRSFASRARDGASDALDQIGKVGDDIAGRVGAAGDAAQRGYATASEASKRGARDLGRRLRAAHGRAEDLRDRIAQGTQDLSEEARARVIRARHAAADAQERVERAAREASHRASDFYEDQPLVVGALALAVGAALGGALPSTRREDAAFGETRDHLFEEARRIYDEERAKLARVADAAAEEARAVVDEAGETLRGEIPDGRDAAAAVEQRLRDAGQRIADAADREAAKPTPSDPA